MNYTYEIEDDDIIEIGVTEIGVLNLNWSIKSLRNDFTQFRPNPELTVNDSFNRTREWVLENHPELLI